MLTAMYAINPETIFVEVKTAPLPKTPLPVKEFSQ